MTSTGIVRKLDRVGRVVIPHEILGYLGIKVHDFIDISIDNSNVVLHKFEPGCVFCGSHRVTSGHKGKFICRDCRIQIHSIAQNVY